MSDLVIVLMLLVPIIAVVMILNSATKRRKKKAQQRINAYITEATRQTSITNYYRKQLVHQTLILDEKGRKLLIVEHNGVFSFEVFPLDSVSGNMVVNIKQPFKIEGKGQKQEHITTRIGVELKFRKIEGVKFIKFYDHLEHNVYMIADFEKEAHQVREKIESAIASN